MTPRLVCANVRAWGSYGHQGNGLFNYPRGVAVDTNSHVYVADAQNDRIQKFDADGTFLKTWGTTGSGNGQFTYPQALAVGANGHVYVADTWNHRVEMFRQP